MCNVDLHQVKQIELHYIYLHALKSQQPSSNIHVIHWLLAWADLTWVESTGPDVLYLDWHISTMWYLLNHSALSDIKSLWIGISCKSNNQISRRIQQESGEPLAHQYFLQRIAVAVQRGNAAAVLGTSSTNNFDLIYICSVIFPHLSAPWCTVNCWNFFLFLFFFFFSMTWQACLYNYTYQAWL